MLFTEGTYNKKTGTTDYKLTSQPIIEKMTHLQSKIRIHCSFENIFFGLSLFFFVISSFLDVLPQTTVFRKGCIYPLLVLY
jgi:hypothetical protein